MKEINLLPEWYKRGRRQRVGCWTQYISLGVVFLMMLAWNFITTASVSRASAALVRTESQRAESEVVLLEVASIKNTMSEFKEKASQLSRIATRINVPCVLAELSFLVGDKVVMSKVDVKAERFAGSGAGVVNNVLTIRAARPQSANNEAVLLGDARFKVKVNGVASGAADVAGLICRLEDSPYFHQVIPSFSRNIRVRTKGRASKEDYRVSEFEIDCYLANYTRQNSYFARDRVRVISER